MRLNRGRGRYNISGESQTMAAGIELGKADG